MNKDLFENLIYEEESTTLDFKSQQYRFSKESEEVKSELLKDIIGFANAWRRSDSYILIGVKEVRGGRGEVVGIDNSEHLDDHALQQFVNNLTNRPVRFHYEAFEFEGVQVGIIKIEQQIRPIYLKRNYGRLLKETVYVRRGSSTDPTKPASLDEIAQMGSASQEPSCELVVEFADTEREVPLGRSISWEAENCAMPNESAIPDLRPPEPSDPFGLGLTFVSSVQHLEVNSNYYRELAHYEFVHRLFRPVRFVIKNSGEVAARNVQIDLRVPGNIGVVIIDGSDVPSRPSQKDSPFWMSHPNTMLDINRHAPGSITISEKDEYCIEIECGDLQPGRKVWSDTIYVGSRETRDITLQGTVFADNLPKPSQVELYVDTAIEETSLSLTELLSM
ncbi:ATP-binding protein [Marinobacter sp. S0848L]|uniref:AlbA family DNA-binding domain-containing protein n=1 Tax=Marinobacter sp. S0848L TaxID=2926423 RepID=UPI001FF3D075|nr:ATP-binding protein [Marinobacter sp. S0848L]MCK0105655.1 ATP-binding protein [Marinobacter sp. S0848L]